MQEDQIINKVAGSSLVSFDLEKLYQPGDRVIIDIKDQLHDGVILREKNFRDYIKETNWEKLAGKFVAITCSADAIVPTWAYMLISSSVQPYASKVIFGSLDDLESLLFFDQLSHVDWTQYENAKVVIKGCSKINVPLSSYVEVMNRLRPIASSIMYGEPCSTVPLFKKPRI